MNFGIVFRILAFTISVCGVRAKTVSEPKPVIIGGVEAYLGQFPWQVLLKKESYGDVLCGGSIISENWILTAAHCTHRLTNGVFVIYGTVEKDNHNQSQTVPQENIIVHPKYNHESLRNDVSLIELVTPLKFNEFQSPIKLLFDDHLKLVGKTAVATGFGVMSDEILEYSDKLLKTTMKVVENSVCERIYNTQNITFVTKATICASPPPGKDNNICSGDSGGPLVILENKEWLQIGINSFAAEEACTEGNPSGFVRISKFRDFIFQNTNSLD